MSKRGHCLQSDMHQLTRVFIYPATVGARRRYHIFSIIDWIEFLNSGIESTILLVAVKKRILAPNSSVLSSWVIDDFSQIWIFILKRRKGLWQHWEFLRFILRHFTRAQIFHLPVGCSSPTPHSKPSVEKLLCHTNNVLNLNTKCNA